MPIMCVTAVPECNLTMLSVQAAAGGDLARAGQRGAGKAACRAAGSTCSSGASCLQGQSCVWVRARDLPPCLQPHATFLGVAFLHSPAAVSLRATACLDLAVVRTSTTSLANGLVHPPCLWHVISVLEHIHVSAQAVGYKGLSGSQRLDILDALIHVATDSEGFRAYITSTVRQQARSLVCPHG